MKYQKAHTALAITFFVLWVHAVGVVYIGNLEYQEKDQEVKSLEKKNRDQAEELRFRHWVDQQRIKDSIRWMNQRVKESMTTQRPEGGKTKR